MTDKPVLMFTPLSPETAPMSLTMVGQGVTPTVTPLLRVVETMVEAALFKAVGGEQGYSYAVSLTVVPDAQPGAFVPVLVIVLTGPTAIIGERTFNNLLSFDLHPNAQDVERMIAQAVEQMRTARSQSVHRAGGPSTV